MTKLFDVRKWSGKPSSNSSTFRLVLILGGSKQELAFRLARQPNTIVVVIDCEEELNRLKYRHQRYGIYQFSLGSRESLETLCETATVVLSAASDKVASMLAREGCGASPMAAELAAKMLITTDEFNHFLQTVIAKSIQDTKGRIACYELLFLASYCGGVGAGVVSALADATMKELSSLEIPVKCTFDLLGPLTYTGISPLAGQNAACALGNIIRFATQKHVPEFRRMVIRVHLHELLPFGQDREARNCLLAINDQAIRSTELQEHLIQIAPNQATTGRLGGVVSSEMEVFSAIDEQDEVIPTVAQHLSSDLSDQLEGVLADPALILEKRWEQTQRTLNRRTVSDLVSGLEQYSFEEFLTAVLRSGTESTYKLILNLGKEGGEFDLAKSDEYYSEPPRTCTQAVQRLSHLKTFSQFIEDEIDTFAQELQRYEAEIKKLVPSVERAYGRLRRRSFLRRTDKLNQELTRLAERARELQDQERDVEVQLATLMFNQRKVQTEEEYLRNRMKDVQTMLEKFVPRGRERFSGEYVLPHLLDNAFESVLRLTLEPESEQGAGLARLAPMVSLAGLAHIVGSPVIKVDDIARRIVFGTPAIQCPPHGAVTRTDRILKAYCIPPMDGAFSEELREKIRLLDPEAVVVFNDSTEGCFTICRYEFRAFKKVDQLIVGILRRDLKKVEDSPTGMLRHPTGKYEMPCFDEPEEGSTATPASEDDPDRLPTYLGY